MDTQFLRASIEAFHQNAHYMEMFTKSNTQYMDS